MKIGKLDIKGKKLLIVCGIVIAVIGCVILLNRGDGKGKNIFNNPDKNIKIVKSEASKIELILQMSFLLKNQKDGKLIH